MPFLLIWCLLVPTWTENFLSEKQKNDHLKTLLKDYDKTQRAQVDEQVKITIDKGSTKPAIKN